jgi:hypothetical protein
MAITGEGRLKCWHAVYLEYVAHGYMKEKELKYRYSLHDALPDTATFLVEEGGRVAGTVTVFPDSPLGLPAEEAYGMEIGELRRAGRSPAEVGRLVIAPEYAHEKSVLAALFDVLSLHARRLMGATDLVITVNPTHVKFYETMLLFERIGEQRELGSVCGAPAVLMRLDLELQKDVIRFEHGEGTKPEGYHGRRTFYRYFSTEAEERDRVRRIRAACGPLSRDFLREYFVEGAPLLLHLSSPIRYFFEKCYPGLALPRCGTEGWAAG